MISKILEQFINLLVSFPGTLQAVSIKNIMMDTQNEGSINLLLEIHYSSRWITA